MRVLTFLILMMHLFQCKEDIPKSTNIDQNKASLATQITRNPITENISFQFLTKIHFSNKNFNFGEVREGKKIRHNFEFKNIGQHPLLIEEVYSSCGCTITNWPSGKILANQSNFIEVTFNTNNKTYNQNKIITIIANTTPRETHLRLTGIVTPKSK